MATVTITVAELRRAADWARPDPKLPLPVLHHVRVSVVGSQVVLAVYDWETCLLARAAGTPSAGPLDDRPGPASVLVPDDQLTAAIKTLPAAGPVEVTVHDGDKVDLVTGAGTAKARRVSVGQTVDPAKYPAMPALPPITGYADGAVLIPALARVAGCCSTQDEQPVLASVHFVPGDGTLALEGTNRFILALDEVPFRETVPGRPPGGAGWLIPAKLVTSFTQMSSRSVFGAPVFVSEPGVDGMALLSDGWHTLVTKVISGEYPKVRTRVNRRPECLAEFTADADNLFAACGEAEQLLAEAVDAMCTEVNVTEEDEKTSVDRRRAIHVEHDGRGMFVTISGEGVEVVAIHPRSRKEIARWSVADAASEEEVTVSLDPGYLARLLPADGTVTVRLSAPLKPVTVTQEGSLFEGVICPIKADMPVREVQPA